uniref:Protein MRG1 isoform X3 n=1 Tax=Rhizophora mucronata TaxID=61149 RepID=A0A2P2M337_RHIMU
MGSSSKDDSGSEGDTSSGDPAPSSPCLFAEGERVLAYHGPRIYEAKVQKAECRKKDWGYFVHYLGWNKSWDEWVGTDRLMKHTEENVMKQQALEKKLGVDKNSKLGRSAQTKSKSSTDAKIDKEDIKSNVAKGKKRKGDSNIEVWLAYYFISCLNIFFHPFKLFVWWNTFRLLYLFVPTLPFSLASTVLWYTSKFTLSHGLVSD